MTVTSRTKLALLYKLWGQETVLLPVYPRTKKCFRENWQQTNCQATWDSEYRRELMRSSVAVLFGPNNLAGLDCDNDSAVERFLELNPWAKDTPRTRGARGATFHFRIRGEYPRSLCKFKANGEASGEWRGANGYTVVSGIHPDTGKPYRILVEKPVLEIAWNQIKWPPEWELPWNRPAPEPAPKNTSAAAPPQNIRIRAYIDGCPPAVSGNGGHIQTLKVATQLVVDFALPEAEAFEWLRYYNQKCEPPWSEKELRHKVQEAAKNQHGHVPGSKSETAEEFKARKDREVREEFDRDYDIVDEIAALEAEQPSADEPLFPYPVIDPKAFYGPFGRIVQAVAPLTEADPVAVLVQLLIGWGNLIGRSAYFSINGTRHYTNLFCCIVGRTAKARKGLALGVAQWLLERIDPEWAKACIRSGLSTGEGLIWRVRDPIVKTQPIKEKGKFTGEIQTYVEDEGITDKRLLIAETEFGSALTVMGRSGNTLSAVVRDAFDGKEQLGTIVKNSPATATGAHISIIEQITAHELRSRMPECDQWNGFANRILWACAKRAHVMSEPPDLSESELGAELSKLIETTVWAKDVANTRRWRARRWRSDHGPVGAPVRPDAPPYRSF